jgi:Flp pilus assembly protein TadG
MRHTSSALGRQRAKRSSNEWAQGLVEFALVIPILLILAMGVIDFGWGLRAYITVTNSAREGARLGVTCATDDAIKAQVASYSSGLLNTSNVTVVSNPCKNGGKTGDPLTVKVTYNYKYITPLGSLMSLSNTSTLTMNSSTTMRAE